MPPVPTRESIRVELKRILVEVLQLDLPPEQIRDNDTLFAHGLGVDSVEAIEILRAAEKRFGVKVLDEEIGFAMFQDVTSLGKVIEEALAREAPAAPAP